MSYFSRTERDWDHARDLAKHSFPAAEVDTKADPEVPGRSAHIITGFTEQDVQAEINRLMDFTDKPGEGHFDRPKKVGSRWASCGWTRFGRAS